MSIIDNIRLVPASECCRCSMPDADFIHGLFIGIVIAQGGSTALCRDCFEVLGRMYEVAVAHQESRGQA